MRTRRYSITLRQAESLCAALTLAIREAEENKAKEEHSPYWELRKKEWEELEKELTNYKWVVG